MRWKKEYLQTLQTRQKWHGVKPNFAVGEVVLLSDSNLPRRKWSLDRIVETFNDDQGLVRQVLVKAQNKTFKRPISKLFSEDCTNSDSQSSKQRTMDCYARARG